MSATSDARDQADAAEPKSTRMNREDRRGLILAAAADVFARGGYAGTSTDTVAKAAGVSQPYVVRMFGGKAELFLAVLRAALARTVETFAAELDHIAIDPASDTFWAELGHSYNRLASDGVHALVLMQGFVAGADPAIGEVARAAVSQIYNLIVERTGCTPDQARDFIAHGMLVNVLLAIDAPEHRAEHSGLAKLTRCTIDATSQ